jgi:hypothetical protein
MKFLDLTNFRTYMKLILLNKKKKKKEKYKNNLVEKQSAKGEEAKHA